MLPGIYKHYKGNLYKVLGTCKHTETNEELVLYKALYGKEELWVRPIKMFEEKVKVNGVETQRFELLSPEVIS